MGLLAALIARSVLIGPDVTSVDLAGSTVVGEVDDE
jgi:hypothetical protein